MIEFEVRVLNVDYGDALKLILDNGGTIIGEGLMKRHVYDIPGMVGNKWVRLRQNVDGVGTITYKEIMDSSIGGTKEIEVSLSDFDVMHRFLISIGLDHSGYQENYRTQCMIDDVEVTIDRWPQLQPFIEIEGKNESDLLSIVKKLGFTNDDITTKPVIELYKDIGVNLKEVNELTFDDTFKI